MGLFGTQTKNEKSAPVMMEEPPQETFQELPRLPKPRVGTVIAKEITISGALRGDGIVQVEGVIEGQVEMTGSIIVTTTGIVKGPISQRPLRQPPSSTTREPVVTSPTKLPCFSRRR